MNPSERLHALDAARVFALLLGIVLHATMSDRGIRQIVIPAGVWHVTVNVGQEEALLVNFPTKPHNHESPDRSGLPWDTDLIPLDLRTLMPASWMAR